MQYRVEISRSDCHIMRCAPAYHVADDGVLYRENSVVIRFEAGCLAEARAMAAFYSHKLKKKGEL